ncbi:MAG: hypothetical protein ABIT38_00100, partial [Gemmatimonadaceae bacterium]
MALPPFPEILPPLLLPPPPPPSEVVVQFPISWFLRHAPSPLQYRALAEVAKLAPLPERALSLVYSHRPALLLAIRQQLDGSWNTRMLSTPREGEDELTVTGSISAVRRLLELGWERDTPTLLSARRLLFRLLAEDNDPAFLYELGEESTDQDLIHRGRLILREAAAATLAQCGYEADPRLRGCAHRIIARVGDFLSGPLAEKPWIRQGNRHLLSGDASPPSMQLLHMLAFMPQFRSEHTKFMGTLYDYLSRPLPRQDVQQIVGANIISQPHYVLGDPLATRGVADGDVPFALYWLELMARLGFLRRHENWTRL